MKLGNIFDRTLNVMALLAAIILVLIMLGVTFEVVTRQLLGGSRIWVIELAEYGLLFMTLLTAAWLLRREGHVRMDIVVRLFKPRVQTIINIITTLLAVIVFSTITWFGVVCTLESVRMDIIYPTLLRPPQWILLLIIPVGTLFLLIQCLRRSCGYLRELRMLSNNK
jgi:TRAP-type C4-dicarboxylate transport system permease small subunit